MSLADRTKEMIDLIIAFLLSMLLAESRRHYVNGGTIA